MWHGQEGQAGSTNEGWRMVANEGVAQIRRAAWTMGWHGRQDLSLRMCDVTSVCSGVPTEAPWATCAGKHLLGMVHAHMAGKVYKPMIAAQKFGQVCPQKIYGEL